MLSVIVSGVLNPAFALLLAPLAVLVIPALYYSRHDQSILELWTAYSIAASLLLVFLTLISFVPLQDIARYPFLPIYALLIAGGNSRKAVGLASGFGVLSLVLPPGIDQLALPYIGILAVLYMNRRHRNGPGDKQRRAVG